MANEDAFLSVQPILNAETPPVLAENSHPFENLSLGQMMPSGYSG